MVLLVTPSEHSDKHLRKKVGILVFPDVEVLDFCGPFEVFSDTRLDETQRRDTVSPFEPLLIAERDGMVEAAGGLRLQAHHGIHDCPPLDILVVPGGWGTRREIDNPVLIDWIAATGPQVETLCSVCTGAMLLGKAGLLDGLRATTHFMSFEWMRTCLPGVRLVTDEHVVDNGRVLTSAGISAGIDMTLQVVSRHYGEAVGRATARYMEYPYPQSNARHV